MNDNGDIQAKTRDRSIALAVLTAIASKCGTLLLRLISIPVAIRTLELGLAEFGVYIAILTIVTMVDLLHVGIGPALTQRLSKAHTEGNIEAQKRVVATSMVLSISLTALFGAILAIVIWKVPIPVLFGEKFAPFADSMKTACWLALVIIAVEFICILIDRARDGYMETRISNLWGAAGNVAGAIVLFVGIRYFPTISFLILAVNGSVAAAKLANTIHFFAKRRFLTRWIANFDRSLVKPLALAGLVFTVTYSLSAMVEYSGLNYLVGRYLGPSAAATAGIFVTIHVSLNGILQMFTVPAWPALIDARGRGDFEWVRKTGARLQILAVLFGLGAIGGIALLGPWGIPLWIGEEVVLDRVGMIGFACFFAAHLWRHGNQILLLGFDREKSVARVLLVEGAVVLAVAWSILHFGGTLSTVYFGGAAAILLVTGWNFPLRFRGLIRQESEPEDHPIESTGLVRNTDPVGS
ncbi:MAG: lipopolysaccharide biosynthesis protein [Verrucomicrobiales bacterium]|nr:lipopolysaccharide biosynthesis protein [Verrucomicrobiales bacterium]